MKAKKQVQDLAPIFSEKNQNTQNKNDSQKEEIEEAKPVIIDINNPQNDQYQTPDEENYENYDLENSDNYGFEQY